MSVYSVSTEKTIFNLPKQVATIDISTRNEYQATIVGEQAGQFNQGFNNVFIGYQAGYSNYYGQNNVFMGANAAALARGLEDNIIIGTDAGKYIVNGKRNIYMGGETGAYLNGNASILIGYNNTTAGRPNQYGSSSNIGIGYLASIFGSNNIALGNKSKVYSTDTIAIGGSVEANGANSIIMGNNIYNQGENVLILNTVHNSNGNDMVNLSNDYLNIQDVFVVQKNEDGISTLSLSNTSIEFKCEKLGLSSFDGSTINFGDIISLGGKYSSLLLDSNIRLVLSSGGDKASQLVIENHMVYLGGSNVDTLELHGSNTQILLTSNSFRLLGGSNFGATLNSNYISIGGSNVTTFSLYGSNSSISMCNNGTFIKSNLTVQGTTTFNSNLVITSNQIYVRSNITFYNNLNINSNSVINVGSNVTFCNDQSMVFKGSGELFVQQKMSTQDVSAYGKISLCNNAQSVSNYLNWDNVTDTELQHHYGSTIIQKNLFIGGMMYSAGMNVGNRIEFLSGTNQWNQYVQITSNQNPYLVFESSTGTRIKLGDDFTPELFNFTGKHRCSSTLLLTSKSKDDELEELIGKIVIATGEYCSLDNKKEIEIDEAVPVIDLASQAMDTRAFGVISGRERDRDKRVYRLGNLHFERTKFNADRKFVVNSVGEGAIWVCNINGNFRNGDLITTSSVPGYGMKQQDDLVHNYTVGKITCDCDFDAPSQHVEIKQFEQRGILYKKAFVGCVYKF